MIDHSRVRTVTNARRRLTWHPLRRARGEHNRRTFCKHCGDVIGVYEPMVLRTPTGDHTTSLLAAESDRFPSYEDCYHEACYLLAVAGAAED